MARLGVKEVVKWSYELGGMNYEVFICSLSLRLLSKVEASKGCMF